MNILHLARLEFERPLSSRTVIACTLLLAAMVDHLSALVYANTKDAKSGINRPRSLVAILTGEDTETNAGTEAYASGDDFDAARRAILEGVST